MTHPYPNGFLRPAVQAFRDLHVLPFDPQIHRAVRTSEAPAVVVPSA